ncbi:deoxycytidyl transferase [Ceratobasidium sp. 423]|nr:deoxycytidyl transferase [Ceratobasidium sp. 423]
MPGSQSPNTPTNPLEKTISQSSDYFDDDPEFSQALATLDDSVLFGSQPLTCIDNVPGSLDDDFELSGIRSASQGRKRKHSPIPGPENSQEALGTNSSRSSWQESTLGLTTLATGTLSLNSPIGPVTPAKIPDTYHASKFGEFGDYFRRKRAKLQNQNADLSTQDNRPPQSSIFKSLAIYITGRTVPSLQILRSLILQHGGQFHAYLDRKEMVTHVVTSNITPAKAMEFKNMKVVRPEWLLDSIAANKLLPWTDYRWSENHYSSPPVQNATPRTPMPTSSIRPLGSSFRHANTPATLDSPLKRQPNNPGESLPPLQPTLLSGDTAKEPSQVPRMVDPESSNVSSDHAGTSDLAQASAGSSRTQYAIHAANPDAERLMESAEWRGAHTSASGEAFIQGYYQHSRLHHLSKWKSELRSLVAKAQEDAESQFSSGESGVVSNSANVGKGKGKGGVVQKVIMHCDFDSFFVSAGLVARPELKGKPVAVCHSSGKGVAHSTSEVASASYAARAFGVKNGMSLGQAKKLCPKIQTIPYEFERYKELSLKFYTILMSLSDDLQAVSVDEALIDVSSSVENLRIQAINFGQMQAESYEKLMAEMIRDRVREKTGCEVSVGIGPNIMLARLATKKAKPAGSFYLSAEDAPAHIADLDIVNLHGFAGAVRDKAVVHFGTSRLGDLAKHGKNTLQRALGDKNGERIWNAIRGIDDRSLESDKPRKSVSADVNYGIRFESNGHAEKFVHGLAKEVSERLSSINKTGRSLTLKIMKRHPDAPKEAPKFMGHGKCETFNKTCSISGPRGLATNDPDIIGREAWKLLLSMRFDPSELRGIGIQIQKLDDAEKSIGAGTAIHGQLAKRFQHALAKADAAKQKNPAKAIWGAPHQRLDMSIIDVDILDANRPNVNPGCKAAPYDLTEATQVNLTNENRAASPQPPLLLNPVPVQTKPTGRANDVHKDPKPVQPVQPRALAAEVTIIDVDALETQRPAPGAKELPYDLTILSQVDQETLVDMMADRSYCSRSSSAPRFGHPGTNSKAGSLSPRVQNRRRFTKMGPPTTIPDPSRYFPIFQRQFAPIPDQELVALGIDPMAYANMPRDRQKALVSTRRAAKGLDGNGRPIYQRKRRFVEDGDKPVHHVILAGRTELPSLRAAAPGIPAVTETSDVQDMIRLWVETKVAKKLGPDPREVAHFGGFLERSMVTDSGMQRTIEVMKWWKDICMKSWGIERERRGQYGREWWVAWWEVKDKLDGIVKKRFGGKLNLD